MKKITALLMVTVIFLALFIPLVPSSAQEGGRQLIGALVYNENCGRCHNFRPAEERTDRGWEIIVTHMRVRANLTAAEARAVLKFLQDFNAR